MDCFWVTSWAIRNYQLIRKPVELYWLTTNQLDIETRWVKFTCWLVSWIADNLSSSTWHMIVIVCDQYWHFEIFINDQYWVCKILIIDQYWLGEIFINDQYRLGEIFNIFFLQVGVRQVCHTMPQCKGFILKIIKHIINLFSILIFIQLYIVMKSHCWAHPNRLFMHNMLMMITYKCFPPRLRVS